MNSDFSDLKDKMNDILSHHGREGQKWGVRNGPPYPLNREGLRSFRENRRRKKLEKQKRKALKDPELLSKSADMFTEQELAEALTKLQLINQYKREAGLSVDLSKKKRKMANTPSALLANLDKYSPEEYKSAFDRLKKRETIKNMIADSTDRPAKVLGNIASGTKSVSNTIYDASRAADVIAKYSGGLTSKERHDTWLETHRTADNKYSYAEMIGRSTKHQKGEAVRNKDLDDLASARAEEILKTGIQSKHDADNLRAYMDLIYGKSNNNKKKNNNNNNSNP